MKYTLSNTIDNNISIVDEKISDPNGTKQWTEGLQSFEQISGQYCDVGSKRKLYYLFKNKKMLITETILEQDLPHSIKFLYESKMSDNIVELVFEKLNETQVKQTCHTEMKLKGLMKILGFIFTGMFKKQTMKYMTAFKHFAEEQNS